MKRAFTFLLLLTIYLNSVAAVCTSCVPIIFRENKGQWENNVLYKAEMKSAAVFFEKNCITFNLIDTRDVLRIRGDHHKLENYKPVIDYTIHLHAFKLRFLNSASAITAGEKQISEYFNYFLDSDRTKWASNVKGFNQLNYKGLYNGTDFKVTSKDGSLKYIYEVKPGANASDLQVEVDGADGVNLDYAGNLQIKTSVGDVTDLKPYAYQIINGVETEVACRYSLKDSTVSFNFPAGYDKNKTLYVDPSLIFSTYSGSTADNFGYSATYDSKGNAFAAGSVFGIGYPVTTGAYQMNYVGGPIIRFTTGGQYPGDDISITKYSADGSQRIFSTYLGGYGEDLPHSLIANSKDELYVLGTTSSLNFPTTATAYDTSFNGGTDPGVFDGIAADYKNGSDIIIAHLSVDGSQLLSSTYVGGSDNDGLNYTPGQSYSTPGFLRHNYADEVRGEIILDKDDNVYVASTTHSPNFPRTTGTFQTSFGGSLDACVFKMDGNLSQMIWSTTFGGSSDEAAYSLVLDRNNDLFVTGGTRSTDFPTTSGVVQTVFRGGEADGFIVHVSKDGQNLFGSTFYGYNDYDQCYFVDVDNDNNVFVLGQADSSKSNFIHNAAFNQPNGGQFITKMKPTLDSIFWSTSFGRGLGTTDISPTAFLVDVCNNIYVCGWGSASVNSYVGGTGSGTTGLPVTAGAIKDTTDGQDFYLMVMKDDASALTYATFIGGDTSEEHVDGGTSRFDKKGIVYESVCAGCGKHSDFPTTPGVVSPFNRSNNCNNAVFKFDLQLPLVVADFYPPPSGCAPYSPTITNASKIVGTAASYQWSFGDGGTSTDSTPTHTYTTSGFFTIKLIVIDPASCNVSDTVTKTVLILGHQPADTLPYLTVCAGNSVLVGINPLPDTASTYMWSPATGLSQTNVPNPLATLQTDTKYMLIVSNGLCVDTFYRQVFVFYDSINIQGSNVVCAGDTMRLNVTDYRGGQQFTYVWQPTGQIVSGANTANPLVAPVNTTTYSVTATNQLGCVYTDTITVSILSTLPNVDAIATPDTIQYGDSSQLSLTYSQGVISFQWQADSTLSADNISNPIATPRSTHTYFITVADAPGCKRLDTVTVYVVHTPCAKSNIYIPDAFSPNGDGKNDVLYMRGNDISNIYFAVYDRWGQRMFESRSLDQGWDGTYKGKKLDAAVFGYYAKGECSTGEKFIRKGNVTILR